MQFYSPRKEEKKPSKNNESRDETWWRIKTNHLHPSVFLLFSFLPYPPVTVTRYETFGP